MKNAVIFVFLVLLAIVLWYWFSVQKPTAPKENLTPYTYPAIDRQTFPQSNPIIIPNDPDGKG